MYVCMYVNVKYFSTSGNTIGHLPSFCIDDVCVMQLSRKVSRFSFGRLFDDDVLYLSDERGGNMFHCPFQKSSFQYMDRDVSWFALDLSVLCTRMLQ